MKARKHRLVVEVSFNKEMTERTAAQHLHSITHRVIAAEEG